MDHFHFANVKPKNNTSITTRYNFFTTISKTLRILELFLTLFLLSWILTRLPFALHISAQYSRKLFSFLANPLFIFALSNAIIAALVAQSRRLSAADSHAVALLNRDTVTVHEKPPSEIDSQPRDVAEVEYQEKEVIYETRRIEVDRTVENLERCNKEKDFDFDFDSDLRKYRRIFSEKLKGEVAGKMMRRKFRRSETEKRPECLYPEDNLSNEEFQRTIEDFIAKQMRFLKEESSSAIVVQNLS
ncbi:hypothetical protein TanjilG_04830 [Lupinus angustifolius]|uniref:DUF4408 domain-containing protein n=1 Tax=Lupinus angustifolius TaxID=3871 RepID=A0A4P1QS60_LUPAN|nr:PREDICTED: uncharacterized protein LOC109332663 [Lupinus angustifolius]OIV93598.1 hypothetical protein TanjilG_04830 [Lupinus angustifolius]